MEDINQIKTIIELREKFGSRLPKHIGIILDGNRRWIRKQGISDTLKGHMAGYKNLRKILYSFFDAGTRYLSIYALSTKNVQNRSEKEVSYLYRLLVKSVNELVQDQEIKEKQVCVQIIGRIKHLPQEIQQAIQKANEATAKYNKLFVNVCINYDGQEEIVDAVKTIIAQGYSKDEITKEIIKKYLYTSKFPELDYLIRTGMDDGARISGFLLWDSSYAEFCFRKDLWPDYNESMLLEDLKEYLTRNRRKGK